MNWERELIERFRFQLVVSGKEDSPNLMFVEKGKGIGIGEKGDLRVLNQLKGTLPSKKTKKNEEDAIALALCSAWFWSSFYATPHSNPILRHYSGNFDIFAKCCSP